MLVHARFRARFAFVQVPVVYSGEFVSVLRKLRRHQTDFTINLLSFHHRACRWSCTSVPFAESNNPPTPINFEVNAELCAAVE